MGSKDNFSQQLKCSDSIAGELLVGNSPTADMGRSVSRQTSSMSRSGNSPPGVEDPPHIPRFVEIASHLGASKTNIPNNGKNTVLNDDDNIIEIVGRSNSPTAMNPEPVIDLVSEGPTVGRKRSLTPSVSPVRDKSQRRGFKALQGSARTLEAAAEEPFDLHQNVVVSHQSVDTGNSEFSFPNATQLAVPVSTDLWETIGFTPNFKARILRVLGFRSLHTWQESALRIAVHGPQKNFLYTAYTAGGKTAVALLLVLRDMLVTHKDHQSGNVVMMFPLKTLVTNKVEECEDLGNEFGFEVEVYYGSFGNHPVRIRKRRKTLWLCTFEKGYRVVQELISEHRKGNRHAQITTLVVDEVHNMAKEKGSDRSRNLELFLTRMLCLREPKIALIGISATLSNVHQMSRWLQAAYYTADGESPNLDEHVVYDGIIYVKRRKDQEAQQTNVYKRLRSVRVKLPGSPVTGRNAGRAKLKAGVMGLLSEKSTQHSNTLVFLPSKKEVYTWATEAALPERHIEWASSSRPASQSSSSPPVSLSERRLWLTTELSSVSHKHAVLKHMANLQDLIMKGIGIHHGDMVEEERHLIENAYQDGIIGLLFCTTTLAEGINLPVDRVMICPAYYTNLTMFEYVQMKGRAGRRVDGDPGSSYLFVEEEVNKGLGKDNSRIQLADNSLTWSFLAQQCVLRSEFTDEQGMDQLKRGLLDVLMEHEPCNRRVLNEFSERLFLSFINRQNKSTQVCKSALCELLDDETLVTYNCTDDTYTLTTLARAATVSGISINRAHTLRSELISFSSDFTFLSPIPRIFLLLNPEHINDQRFDTEKIRDRVIRKLRHRLRQPHQYSKDAMIRCAKHSGISSLECFVERLESGPPKDKLFLRRLYLTLFVEAVLLAKNEFIATAREYFPAWGNRAFGIYEELAAEAQMMARFSKELGLDIGILLEAKAREIKLGSGTLAELMQLPGLSFGRATLIQASGINSIREVSELCSDRLMSVLNRKIKRKDAEKIIEAAKRRRRRDLQDILEDNGYNSLPAGLLDSGKIDVRRY
eukprot:Clim_evm76s142 gene=Clim_evmTU76s142